MRYAIYHAPERGHPLTQAAISWLGRDAFGGPVTQPFQPSEWTEAEHADLVADAARYGFHATLKAPFKLAEGKSQWDLVQAFRQLDTGMETPLIPALALRQIDGFFALVPEQPVESVQDFAALVVREFDRFRAPLTDFDRIRRHPQSLSERQRLNLDNWGYPFVFEDFFFHMTLTRRVPAENAEPIRGALEAHFADFIGKPYEISHIALFTQASPGAGFIVSAIRPIGTPILPIEKAQNDDS